MKTNLKLNIAGIGIGISAPFPMDVPPELRAFLTRQQTIDEQFTLWPTATLPLSGRLVAENCGQQVYQTNDGWLRIHGGFTAPDGNTAATCLRRSGQHSVYLPASDLPRYQQNCTFSRLLGGEYLLFRHSAVILHSSVILWEGKTVLFSGCSGAGKSTQAALWQKHLGAEILNGDRCVLRQQAGKFYGYGSPWCGSSNIYRSEGAPVAAIFLPEKSPCNQAIPLHPSAAFRRLYSELTLNTWDHDFMRAAADFLTLLVETVPIFLFYCRPDKKAVEEARRAAFEKECSQCPATLATSTN